MKRSTNIHSLQEIAEALTISPQKTVLLYNQPWGGAFSNAYTQTASNKMLFDFLQSAIYTVFYARNKEAFTQAQAYPGQPQATGFMENLSRSNASAERFDGGWVIEQIDTAGTITIQKGVLHRTVFPGDFLSDSLFHQAPAAHAAIRLAMRREHKDAAAGFYYAFGDTAGEEASDMLVRFYFNLKPDGAAGLVQWVTTVLNEYRIPFTFKCLQHPALYTRCDSAVLYIEKRYCAAVFHLLPQLYQQLKTELKEDVPLFTKRLGRGIGFAENPLKTDESFGTHCSKMVAQGIMQAHGKGLPNSAWTAEVKAVLEQRHGYTDMEKIHLNPGSAYPYMFPDLS